MCPPKSDYGKSRSIFRGYTGAGMERVSEPRFVITVNQYWSYKTLACLSTSLLTLQRGGFAHEFHYDK